MDRTSSLFAPREMWSWRQHLAKNLLIGSALPLLSVGKGLRALQQSKTELQSSQDSSGAQSLGHSAVQILHSTSFQFQYRSHTLCPKDWKGFGVVCPNSWVMGETSHQPGPVQGLWSWSSRLKHPRAWCPRSAKLLTAISSSPFGKSPVK